MNEWVWWIILAVTYVLGGLMGYAFARVRHHDQMAAFFHRLARVSGEVDRGYFPPLEGRPLGAQEVVAAYRETVKWGK